MGCRAGSRGFGDVPLTARERVSGHVKAHDLARLGAFLFAWAALVATTSAAVFYLPNDSGAITVPFRQLLPAGAAVHVVAYTVLPANHAFPLATDRLSRWRWVMVGLGVMVTGCILGLAAALGAQEAGAGWLAARSVFAWAGLALVSVRWWGRAGAWALPAASILVILMFGYSSDAQPRWFNWSANSGSPMAGTVMAATSLAVGALAQWTTPWRFVRIRPRTWNPFPLRGPFGGANRQTPYS